MKLIIKKIIPVWLVRWYINYMYIKHSKFRTMSAKEVFTEIYNNNWKSLESISGRGSEISHTSSLIKDLENLLNRPNISSVLDIPCGDFNWMRKVDLSKIELHRC